MSYITRDSRTDILLEAIQDAEKQANEDGGSYVCLRTAFDMMLAVAKRHPDWPKPEVEMAGQAMPASVPFDAVPASEPAPGPEENS